MKPFMTKTRVGMRVLAVVVGAVPAMQCSRGYEPAQTGAPTVETQPDRVTQSATLWEPPEAKASGERTKERRLMVETQIERPRDGRQPVTDRRALKAMRAVPRHVFVPAELQAMAYADHPLPIGHDQTISQPYIVALMTELLAVTPETKVLEIGTGSGYQAAVLAYLSRQVYTIELLKPLADRAIQTLREQGYKNVHCRCGDGFLGWPDEAPFDAILLTCAIGEVPAPLWDQLAPGGRIVMPMGEPDEVQELVVVVKTPGGQREVQRIIPVRFVPLVREKDVE